MKNFCISSKYFYDTLHKYQWQENLLIYKTQDCTNVCLGLVWNRYDIINSGTANYLGDYDFQPYNTSTASNRISNNFQSSASWWGAQN